MTIRRFGDSIRKEISDLQVPSRNIEFYQLQAMHPIHYWKQRATK